MSGLVLFHCKNELEKEKFLNKSLLKLKASQKLEVSHVQIWFLENDDSAFMEECGLEMLNREHSMRNACFFFKKSKVIFLV